MIKLMLLSLIVFAAGVGVPIMAAINAGLGARIESPVFATVILLFVGLILAGTYMLLQGVPPLPSKMPPLHSFSGGFFVVFYVLAVTTVAPKIGLGMLSSWCCWGKSYRQASSIITVCSMQSKIQSAFRGALVSS